MVIVGCAPRSWGAEPFPTALCAAPPSLPLSLSPQLSQALRRTGGTRSLSETGRLSARSNFDYDHGGGAPPLVSLPENAMLPEVVNAIRMAVQYVWATSVAHHCSLLLASGHCCCSLLGGWWWAREE